MKKINQAYNNDALESFGLEAEPQHGVWLNSSLDDVIITDNVDIYNNIKDTLSNELKNIDLLLKRKTYKKAFILPSSGVTQVRMKEACKEHDLVITNNIDKADLIITNYDFDDDFSNSEKISSRKLMYTLKNYYSYQNTTLNYLKSKNPILFTSDLGNHSDFSNDESIWDGYALPGLAVNAAYRIKSGECAVIHEDTVLNCSGNLTELTEDLLDEIKTWINSDSENMNLVGAIMPTIDYSKRPHLLWELSNIIHHHLWHFNRNKDVQHWLDRSNVADLYHRSAENMIEYLENNDTLTAEGFKYLEPYARKEISIHNRGLYVFKVQVKQKYRKFYENKN